MKMFTLRASIYLLVKMNYFQKKGGGEKNYLRKYKYTPLCYVNREPIIKQKINFKKEKQEHFFPLGKWVQGYRCKSDIMLVKRRVT